MSKKLELISSEFFSLIEEAKSKNALIEVLCLVLQLFEYACFLIFSVHFLNKIKTLGLKRDSFEDEINIAEKNSSFLAFILFSNGLINYNLYRLYIKLKKIRNRLVHNLVKRTKVDYNKSHIRELLDLFMKELFVFIYKTEVPK